MVNLIYAELFRVKKNKYIYSFVVISILIIFSTMLLISGRLNNVPTKLVMNKADLLNIIPFTFRFLIILMIGFLPFLSGEFRHRTIINLVSSNISRTKIIISKYLVSLIIATIMAFIFISVFLISLIMLKDGDNYSSKMIMQFLMKFIAAVPCFAAIIALVFLLSIVIKNEVLVFVVFYYGIMQLSIIETILEKLVSSKFSILNGIFISNHLMNLSKANCTVSDYISAVGIGLIYSIVILRVSIYIFSKQSIK